MPDLTQSRSADAKFDCNILSRKALDPSQQQLMAEAPVSIPADDLPCAMEGALRRSPRVDSLLLQLRQASQGAEIRTRGPDTGHAGGIDHQAADVQGDLLLDDESFGAAKYHTCVLRLDHVGQCGRFAPFYGGLATLDGGSTEPRRWIRLLGTTLPLPQCGPFSNPLQAPSKRTAVPDGTAIAR
jgi:hypothetical protein